MTPEVSALRTSVALAADVPRVVVEVKGSGAFDALDAVVSADLFARDGRMVHAFVLDSRGRPEADVYVAVDGEDAIVLLDGMSAETFVERLEATGVTSFSALDAGVALASASIHGPYAWELAADVLGDDVLGLPYLAFCRFREVLCFRASTTGEFGYEFVGPPDAVGELVARVDAVLPRYDGARVAASTLEVAALENGFYRFSLAAGMPLDARQLQQQWRVSLRKPVVGRDAIDAGRALGTPVLVHALADGLVGAGDSVRLGSERFGSVAVARPSEVLGGSVARVLVPPMLAHPGIDGLVVETPRGPVTARTVSAPTLHNRSLYVDPRNHTYHDASTRPAPPLAPGGPA